MLKLISWNVNGLRSALKKGFVDFVKKYNPDILCLQEIKSAGEHIEVDLSGYEQFWSHAKKAGYAGTAIFSKIKPISFKEKIGIEKHDAEGRVLTLEYKDFYLVNVYV